MTSAEWSFSKWWWWTPPWKACAPNSTSTFPAPKTLCRSSKRRDALRKRSSVSAREKGTMSQKVTWVRSTRIRRMLNAKSLPANRTRAAYAGCSSTSARTTLSSWFPKSGRATRSSKKYNKCMVTFWPSLRGPLRPTATAIRVNETDLYIIIYHYVLIINW